MEGKRFIRTLRLQNFLSYGSEGETIELQPLNVLIGPNASGKSNLIEAIGILQATSTNLPAPIRQGGGINNFLWKGAKETPTAEIEATIDYQKESMPLRYRIALTAVEQRSELVDEAIEDEEKKYQNEEDVYFYYRYQRGRPVLNVKTVSEGQPGQPSKRLLRREDLLIYQSVLSQRKDPDLYPELSYLGDQFSKIALYRGWQIGRYSQPRMPQQTDLPEHPLLEDASNLGLVLNNLQYQLGSRQIIEKLKKFYDAAEELSIKFPAVQSRYLSVKLD